MRTKQPPPTYTAHHSSVASFNTISLDDEHAAAAIGAPPSSAAASPRAPPTSSTSRFIETCYNHFFPSSASRAGSSVSLNSGASVTAGTRAAFSSSRQSSIESSATDAAGGSSTVGAPKANGRRRAKLTIAIDADEPYAGLAKLHAPTTPLTAGVQSSTTSCLDAAIRSRSTSILSRASLKQAAEKPLKAKESLKSTKGVSPPHNSRHDSRDSNTSPRSPGGMSPGSGCGAAVYERQLRVARGSSVEYSPPATSHYSSAFSSHSSSSAVSPAAVAAFASAAAAVSSAIAQADRRVELSGDSGLSRGTSGDDVNGGAAAGDAARGRRVPRSLGMGRMRSYEAEDDFPYYNLECGGAIERRNHYQFAKVLESASTFAALNASTTTASAGAAPGGLKLANGILPAAGGRRSRDDSDAELAALRAAAASDADFRRRLCEYSLADEMREALRKYKGTPDLDLRTPDRIFKVVFVGDSGVGKTCFLHRFCHNRFRPLFNATIGVDFIVKTIRIRDRLVAVQLWDTAGQERFRSITKQYFRKADGVVLMYDVTSEQSYLNVRNWIESVRVGVDDECVMCLIGNKVDLYPNEECRTITYKHGADLASEFDMIFFETSAYTGLGINDSMRALAFRLQQREDEHLAEAMRLEKGVSNGSRSRYCYCL